MNTLFILRLEARWALKNERLPQRSGIEVYVKWGKRSVSQKIAFINFQAHLNKPILAMWSMYRRLVHQKHKEDCLSFVNIVV